MPAKPAVEVPLLKVLADVVDGDVLRAFRPPHLLGDDGCSHVLVSQLGPAVAGVKAVILSIG